MTIMTQCTAISAPAITNFKERNVSFVDSKVQLKRKNPKTTIVILKVMKNRQPRSATNRP